MGVDVNTFTESDDRALAEWLGLPVQVFPEPLAKERPAVYGRPSLVPYLTAPTPASDYAVLEAVRKKGQTRNVQWHLPATMTEFLGNHKPGDYARAAIAREEVIAELERMQRRLIDDGWMDASIMLTNRLAELRKEQP